ncbi:MAG: hypothetical protein ABI315_13570 [Bacteroidia bacterium]
MRSDILFGHEAPNAQAHSKLRAYYCVKVHLSCLRGLRMATGNEVGANELWLPGGKLPKGYSEAVINQIPEKSFKESLIIIK